MTNKVSITIDIEPDALGTYTDTHLALAWHVAQANPADHGDPIAGDLAAKIGFEIIRRWLIGVAPEMYTHQGSDYYWRQLTKVARYVPGDGPAGSREWHQGVWEPRTTDASEQTGGTA